MKLQWILLAIMVIIGGIVAYKKSNMPLGIRNNNPGNLKDVGISWQGRTGQNQGFVVFDKMENGVRAMTLDITNDYYVDGLKTIRQLISVYAPSSENNTESYVQHVAGKVGVNPDTPLIPLEPYLHDLISAMIYHENGRNIADYDLYRGVQSAMEYRGLA